VHAQQFFSFESNSSHCKDPPGAHRTELSDPVVKNEIRGPDEDFVEEIFGQLWAVPKPLVPRVLDSPPHGGRLVWIRKDLVREKKVRPEDCFPVGRNQRIVHPVTKLSFSRDICRNGEYPSYVEVLKRLPMAEGGHWVWQLNKPQQASPRGGGRAQQGRGRGRGQPQQQIRPPTQMWSRPNQLQGQQPRPSPQLSKSESDTGPRPEGRNASQSG
jgi:hypothetical protein